MERFPPVHRCQSIGAMGVVLAVALAVFGSPAHGQPAAAAEPVPAATVEEAAAADETPKQQSNRFLYLWNASPTFFVGMSLLSMWMIYLVIQGVLRLQMDKVVPPDLVGALDGLLAEKKYKDAYERIKADESPLGKSLFIGIDRLHQGYERALDAMLAAADESRAELEHAIAPINVIAAVAPMLGLLGTVWGMISAFEKIGFGTQIQPALLAKDIGLALVSTLEGLVIAIPAIVAFAFLRNRLARLMMRLESTSESFLVRFAASLKK